MEKQLTDLQTKMLEMMNWFHTFCIDNDITYYMIGGTMLGAARHQGFIPWDDDIDIGIPRKDYDALVGLSASLRNAGSRYLIESYKDGNIDYQYAYAKVYDTSTTLIENRRSKPKRGLFIDVFPLDGISGETREEAVSNFAVINKKLNMLAARTCDVRKGRSWWKNIAVKVVGLLPDSIMRYTKMIDELEAMCRLNDFYSSKYAGNLIGMWRDREIMPRAFFGNPVLYRFENSSFYGVEKVDEYLKNVYGDWRKLPPIEKQKSEHDFIFLDLEHSYLD